MVAQPGARRIGLLTILAGVLWIVGFAGMSHMLPVIDRILGHWLLGIAGVLSVAGIRGVWALDAGRSGLLGRGGYGLTVLGLVVFAIGNIAEVGFGLEVGTALFGIGLLLLIAGVVVLGSALLRSRVVRPWSVLPLMAGLLAFLPVVGLGGATFGPDAGATARPALWLVLAWLGALLLGAGWLTLGYALWTDAGERGRRVPSKRSHRPMV